jgi:hypothetical protein
VSISEEIRASAAAHRDLGPGYDTAVAEGLVERIGEEIDRRIDVRLYGQLRGAAAEPAPTRRQRRRTADDPARIGFGQVVLALGSMGLAVGATGVALHPGSGMAASAPLAALIWIVIAVINVAYARRH